MSERDRLAAAITDYLNGVAHIDTGDMADALLAAGVTMPAPPETPKCCGGGPQWGHDYTCWTLP